MRKIANTTELQTELRELLAYSLSERPSRLRIAAELDTLGGRVAGAKRAAAGGGLNKALKLLEQAEAALKDAPEGDGLAAEVRALRTKLQTGGLFKKGDKVLYAGGAMEGTVTKNQKPGSSKVEVDMGYGKPMLVNVDDLSRS